MPRDLFGLPKVETVDFWGQGKKGKSVSKKILRRIVWERDKGTCQLCNVKIRASEDWDLARKRAGRPYTKANCFVAHHTCNLSQGRKSLAAVKKELGLSKKKTSKKSRKRRKSKPHNLFEIKPVTIKPIKWD